MILKHFFYSNSSQNNFVFFAFGLIFVSIRMKLANPRHRLSPFVSLIWLACCSITRRREKTSFFLRPAITYFSRTKNNRFSSHFSTASLRHTFCPICETVSDCPENNTFFGTVSPFSPPPCKKEDSFLLRYFGERCGKNFESFFSGKCREEKEEKFATLQKRRKLQHGSLMDVWLS